MNEEGYMYVGAALLGGFLLGRWTAPDGTTINVAPSVGEQVEPPALPPLPPVGDAEPGRFSQQWADTPFSVEVYPAGADETTIRPPGGPQSASVAEDCTIVALSVGWWDRAGDIAERQLELGMTDATDIVNKVLDLLMPACADANTQAMLEVRGEIVRRLDEKVPGVLFPPPVPKGVGGLAKNGGARRRRRLRSRTIRR